MIDSVEMAACSTVIMKVFLLLFANATLIFCYEHVPVVVWETKGNLGRHMTDLPSLTKVSSDEFSDLFVKKLAENKGHQPLIAVFLEENLSVEDFSWQDAEGHTAFPHLENLTSSAKHVDFYPSVHAPLKGLKRIGYRWHTLQLENQENDVILPSKGGEILVVKLGEARIDEDRPEFLKRHDYMISEIYNDLLLKNKDIIAVYTSHHSSWVEPAYESLVRSVRSVPEVVEDPIHWNINNVMFYTTVTPTFSASESETINVTFSCYKNVLQKVESIKCKFDNYYLIFKFTVLPSQYWYLNIFISTIYPKEEYEKKLTPDVEIYAPMNFSYHCSQKVVFRNGSMSLTMQNFQIQPNVSSNSFDDAYDCVWFFTVPIWAGLMVTALLGIILMMGIAAIMDINTMDRFDDPKGKPITINASD